MHYLVLPRDGDTACDKLRVEVVVCGVEVHAFDGGELLNVQDVFTVHGSRLKKKKGIKSILNLRRNHGTQQIWCSGQMTLNKMDITVTVPSPTMKPIGGSIMLRGDREAVLDGAQYGDVVEENPSEG